MPRRRVVGVAPSGGGAPRPSGRPRRRRAGGGRRPPALGCGGRPRPPLGGVEELAKYALWSIEADRPEVVADALALRVASVDAADTVFRIAHQLHGAIGFCDETTISWLSRYSAPLRQLPWGASGSLDALAQHIGRRGLTGVYGGPTS